MTSLHHPFGANIVSKTTMKKENSHTHDNMSSLHLHHCHFHKLKAILYRTHSFLQLLCLLAIFYYRATFFFNTPDFVSIPFFPWLLLFGAEMSFSIIWFLKQPFYWWPVTRTVFPERLPKDEKLPGVDVFICTTDPKKEPTFEVMNTVISAMALDYPANKLSVYLSDDGGASVTLNAIKEAWIFATWWLPFCRRYNIKTVCPKAYFDEPMEVTQRREFIEDRNTVQVKYEAFKLRMRNKSGSGDTDGGNKTSARDHPSLVQVINENTVEDDNAAINPEYAVMPSLVYVAREKRPSQPHHFKAGALNVLLRISGTLSNSPYILVLDCDMYCNDSISARQAMCFYLDPEISPTLGWVQYPQKFHNVNENDIYDSRIRYIWTEFWPGADGLQGPVISGSNFYIKREALYGINIYDGNNIIKEARDIFGPSNEFIMSLSKYDMPGERKHKEVESVSVQEQQFLASCTYEDNTKWGEKVGFRYESVVEDVMTGYMLQSKGWRSVYMNPPRPQFLGSATTNLNEYLIQNTRWISGLVEIGLSKYCPLIYCPTRMQIPQRMCLSWLTLYPLGFIPIWCFATVPQISFLCGIPLYPKVTNPFFVPFAFVFISSLVKLLCDVVATGGSLTTWLNEQRSWDIRWLTCSGYGVVDSMMTKLKLREASFIATNKAEEYDTTKLYKIGKYDFRISNMFIVPIVIAVWLNVCCFVGGVARLLSGGGNWDAMFGQAWLSLYILMMSFPVMKGMFVRNKGCMPLWVTLTCTIFGAVWVSVIIVMHH